MKGAATPATEFLARHGVAYTEHFYDYVEHGGTGVSSSALGVPEHDVVKTLIMETDKGEPLVVLMHGDKEVSTKQLARTLGVKSVGPCDVAKTERLTGYSVGGISPFGVRQRMPVYVEKTILDLPKIYINGGKRGFLVEIDPRLVVKELRATPVEVSVGS